MKYIIYCRNASEHEGNEIGSLLDQEHQLLQYAKKMHLDVVDKLLENNSGTAANRPLYRLMMSMIENREADGILVTDISRIYRSLFDGAKIISLINSGQIKEIRTPRQVVNMSGMANTY